MSTQTNNHDEARQRGGRNTNLERMIVTFHPPRHPLYRDFLERFPKQGNPVALRKLALLGFEKARETVERWKKGEIYEPLRESRVSLGRGSTIKEENQQVDGQRYSLYVDITDPIFRPIWDYYQSLLPPGKNSDHIRQVFMRLMLLYGAHHPKVEELLHGIVRYTEESASDLVTTP